ncbi:hypothetical protein EU534_00465 [Candidatus Heimdallarchaeota archaeon]|nr:MAG: hypothetical protein EU534_00465 [Candidatus Heimdallarchaeota archaeon]
MDTVVKINKGTISHTTMKILSKKRIYFVIILLMLCTITMVSERTIGSNISDNANLEVNLTDSYPILITSNEVFIILGFPGNGTLEDPYRIENLRVVSSGQLEPAIIIGNTTVYFTIQNCEIISNFIGIRIIDTVATGTVRIFNNIISSMNKSGGGISIGSSQAHIENNTITGFTQGIHVNEAEDTTIIGNSIVQSYYQGINIRYSSFNTIINNHIRDSNQHRLAIVGETSMYNVIYSNIFANNSNSATYNIDGVITGETDSQGYDGGANNEWYNSATHIGNKWDDYTGEGSYSIDGSADSVDLYPEKYGSDPDQSNYITIIGLVATIGLIAWIYLKHK